MNILDKKRIVEAFATMAHGDQKRKYTGEPYITHPIAVSKLVAKHGGDHNQILAAILHDVFEDTPYTSTDLESYLKDAGFEDSDIYDIVFLTTELTDIYTKEAYPDLNRAQRKLKEAQRLGEASSRAQLIKACDLMDNTESITQHDPKFAKVYIKEKKELAKQLSSIPKYLQTKILEE